MSTQTTPVPPDSSHRSHHGRRPMAAGHVMVVMLVALTVGSFLNAPGILKTAKGQPLGWKRNVAIALAQPLDDVSHFLHTDRLRVGLQDLLGRAGDDTINESSPSPTTVAPSVTTTLPRRASFSAQSPLRLWIGGDSLVDTPGTSLVNLFSANSAVNVLAAVDTHISTGLARPEVFNWPAAVQTVIDTLNPRAIVVSIGSNDNQPMTGDGATGAPFGSDGWKTEYARRIGGLMDEAIGNGRTLFWIGVPIVRQGDKLESYQFINGIIQDQAARRPGRVYYVDTYNLLKGPDGNYADYLANAGGTLVQARAQDGTHYTRFGGDKVAAAVASAMAQAFDLGGTATTTTTAPPRSPTTTRPR